jgi:hypothetical protein
VALQAIIKLAIRYRFNLPPYYTLIVRSLCSLEGLALRVDPSFSIVNAAIPIILRRLLTDTRPVAVALLRELLLEDDKRLRIGMLEGLLRNYSTEAGKPMQEFAADNVVLKGVSRPRGSSMEPYGPSMVLPQSYARQAPGTSDLTREGADLLATNGLDGNMAGISDKNVMHTRGVVVVASAVEEEDKMRLGHSFALKDEPHVEGSAGRREAIAHTSRRAAPVAHGINSADTMHLEALSTAGVANNGASIAVSSRHANSSADSQLVSAAYDDASVARSLVDDSAVSQPASKADSESLVAQVIKMVLSARAAGVRRVLLEADLKVGLLPVGLWLNLHGISCKKGSKLQRRTSRQMFVMLVGCSVLCSKFWWGLSNSYTSRVASFCDAL